MYTEEWHDNEHIPRSKRCEADFAVPESITGRNQIWLISSLFCCFQWFLLWTQTTEATVCGDFNSVSDLSLSLRWCRCSRASSLFSGSPVEHFVCLPGFAHSEVTDMSTYTHEVWWGVISNVFALYSWIPLPHILHAVLRDTVLTQLRATIYLTNSLSIKLYHLLS